MNLRLPRALAYLLVVAAAAAIIPTTTLAQHEENGSILERFDLLLLSEPQKKDNHTIQSILLVSTKQTSAIRSVIQLPSLENEKEYYEHLTPDPESDTVYWTSNSGCVGYFGVRGDAKKYGVLYNATGKHTITGLAYHSKTLYWIEDTTEIKSMQLESKAVRSVVQAGDQEKIQGLVINHQTGALYYPTWSHFSRTKASIWSLENSPTATPKLLASDLLLPTSLSIAQPPYLHWISNPPGIYFHVERLNTENLTERSVTVKQAHQHGSSLAVTCNGVFWTDIVNKRVWKMDSSKEATKYNRLPGGKQVGKRVLGDEQANWGFKEVVAVPQECGGIVPETTTASAEQSESKEDAGMAAQSVQESNKPVIRLCSENEFLQACGSDREIICVVIGTPRCLSQQQRTVQSVTSSTQESSSSTEQLTKSIPVESSTIESTTPTTADPHQQQPNNSNQSSAQQVFLKSRTLSSTSSPDNSNNNNTSSSSASWPPEVIILISVLSTLAAVMSMISLYMTIRVRNLSKKPIIRRRVVVSTRTSESGSSSPASVCEMIDIENCCNMNICETPCYERTLLQPSNSNNNSTCTTTSTTQNGQTVISVNSSNSNWGGCGGNNKTSSKEDKKCLLSR